MTDQFTFAQQNRERIQSVENSFGPSGKPLSKPGRVLVGEGRLMKQSRRGPQPRVFFLFDDMLVYGSIVISGRWYKNQQIIPLGDIQLEDLEDGMQMRNQWLIRTPRKSFFVSASSHEEKQAWMEHMESYRARLVQTSGHKPPSELAVSWIPDQASSICMRCSTKFTVANRRHHCRKCGFVVCSACSKKRAVIQHIHPTKHLRVCTLCHQHLSQAEAEACDKSRLRGDSTGKSGSEDELERPSEEEEEPEEQMGDHDPSRWMAAWSPYVYIKPEHAAPPK